jgi:uncharacterized protein (DUF2147 family)
MAGVPGLGVRSATPMKKHHHHFAAKHVIAAALLVVAVGARGQGADDAKGLWLSAQKDAVIEFKPCPDLKTALCGTIVWDKDTIDKSKANDCGVRVVQVNRFADGAWRDGWAFDPRTKKHYKSIVRVKDGVLRVRAFIGTELLGETEELTRAEKLPPGCPPPAS